MALTTGLVAYYSNDTNGSYPDELGAFNGTISGATFDASGKIAGCYSFDGSNDYVSTALSPTWTDFSINLWVKADDYSSAGAWSDIFDSWVTGAGSIWSSLRIRDSKFYFNVDTGGAGYKDVQASAAAYTDNVSWVMITGVRDTANNVIKIYVDGSWVADTSIAGLTGSMVFTGTWDFGQRGDLGNSEVFGGEVDEVGIWSRALSAAEISSLYNSGSGFAYPFVSDSVTLVTPNGGEVLVQDAAYEITWSSTGTVGNLLIEFSDDNGVSYSTVVASTVNDGSYIWSVPDVDSALCLIRITDVGTPAITDVSDAVFSIIPPPVKGSGGNFFVKTWLKSIINYFTRGKGIVEFPNSMILEGVRSDHLQIAGDFRATVVRVHDGDTVTLRTDFRDFDFPLRLANIDADELSEGGAAARDWLSSRILGKDVIVYVNPKNRVGKYGRLIGEIYCGGFNVGDAMMRLGIVSAFGKKREGHVESFSKIIARAGY